MTLMRERVVGFMVSKHGGRRGISACFALAGCEGGGCRGSRGVVSLVFFTVRFIVLVLVVERLVIVVVGDEAIGIGIVIFVIIGIAKVNVHRPRSASLRMSGRSADKNRLR
jgi:hypothetical protein